jgi:hypothetical protein
VADVKLSLAFAYPNSRTSTFDDCREAMLAFDRAHDRLFDHAAGRISARVGTIGLVAARNSVAEHFLASDSDWLLWIDSDMGFDPDTPYRLLQVADPVERPIVGGLCFVSREVAHDGMMGFRTQPLPTIYDWTEDETGTPRFLSAPMYPVNALIQVRATGSAMVLIHRSVFERMAEHLESLPAEECNNFGQPYDQVRGPNNSLLGEDVSFCVRANALEIPIHVHTGVRTTHFKHRWLSEVDHWRAYNPPPAVDETAVIVPVLRRPQNAGPFMRSLRASTGLATAYAVADADDPETAEAWAAAGAQVIVGDVVTFARKANLGYAKTREPWLFLCGDDVKFHAGWLDHAQHVAEMLHADVVGTNDLANARVMAGEHATHLLVRRSYVDEVGASWDGPGVVTHEGYRHNFVDDEIVTAAKQRGVWQMSLGSVVEHNHPVFNKAEDDEVYQLGQSSYQEDGELFRLRLVEQGLAKPEPDKPKVGAKPKRAKR